VRGSEEYDGFKADVWSAGIVLWAMLTGGLVYRVAGAKDPRFELLALGRSGIEKLLEQDEVTDLPEMVVDLLSKMLAVDVNKRYLIEDVLAHPWISCPCGSSPRPKASGFLDRPPDTPEKPLTHLLKVKEQGQENLIPLNVKTQTIACDQSQSEG